ncbi:hypothetical protein [Aurantimonas sp. A3-2-R12]|uniref:hypothetical protein n=1 Tax=Aurantimonas sp. A3-2-R12 TaxID=3114362 RepID=UPI002E18CD79|nr:hypothetical protein [Aurantimonas sp. A3-2-R12]
MGERYALLAEDLLAVTDNSALDATSQQILNGLLRNSQLRGLSADQMACRAEGVLNSVKGEYLPLSILCSKKFAHSLEFSGDDRDVLDINQVIHVKFPGGDYSDISFPTNGNVIESWNLFDGGNILPEQVLCDQFTHAKSIYVYDRYFGRSSLRSITSALSAAGAAIRGLIDSRIEIAIGRGDGGLTEATIANNLAPLFTSQNNIKIFKSQKIPGGAHIHDRYIQVNQNCTFTFTAGIGCFFDGPDGLNRGSLITRSDLFISRSKFSIRRADGSILDMFR